MNLFDASKIENQVEMRLLPYCERLDVAGSIRRNNPDVGDIEIVARPKTIPQYDLLGEKIGEHSMLNDRKLMESLGVVKKSGQRFVQVELWQGITLDLFIVLPPACWGVIYAIRTGPREFSAWLVTSRSKGGAMHNGYRCEDGRVLANNSEIRFEEELEFLEWLDLGWIEPAQRAPMWGKFPRGYHG